MQGEDPYEALRLVLGEVPLLPYLPELPERGVGADMIGRGAGLLLDLPVEVQPSGWRITARPGRELRRARDLLARDLDALEELAGGHTGAFKIQLPGPWTLAANVELPSGNLVLSDHGAVRELAGSLAEGLRLHLADLGRRLPRAQLVVQLDEPSLPDVLAARIATPSGWDTLRGIGAEMADLRLREVLEVIPAGARVVHCCGDQVPLALLVGAGADALSIDLARLTSKDIDVLGEAVEAGVSLLLGVIPGTDAELDLAAIRTPILRLWSALGFPPERLTEVVVPTPTCGLAGASPGYTRRALAMLGEVAHSLADLDE